MRCGSCGATTEVKDSRLNERTNQIRRRRSCLKCKKRFSTLELNIDALPVEELQRGILDFQVILHRAFLDFERLRSKNQGESE